MTIEIRPIRDDEVSQAVEVLVAGSYSPETEDLKIFVNYLEAVRETRANGGEMLVAVDGHDVIGIVQVVIFRHFQRNGGYCCELESVHVRSDHRSQGIGGNLLRAAEELARSRNCYRIQLTSNNLRTDAHHFYETNGYVKSHLGFKKYLTS